MGTQDQLGLGTCRYRTKYEYQHKDTGSSVNIHPAIWDQMQISTQQYMAMSEYQYGDP